jgi:hypothetical protein
LPGLYSVLCLSIAMTGAWKYSIDYYIFNKRKKNTKSSLNMFTSK